MSKSIVSYSRNLRNAASCKCYVTQCRICAGTDRERGVDRWRAQLSGRPNTGGPMADGSKTDPYDLPYGMAAINRWTWTRRVPFLPPFRGWGAGGGDGGARDIPRVWTGKEFLLNFLAPEQYWCSVHKLLVCKLMLYKLTVIIYKIVL